MTAVCVCTEVNETLDSWWIDADADAEADVLVRACIFSIYEFTHYLLLFSFNTQTLVQIYIYS